MTTTSGKQGLSVDNELTDPDKLSSGDRLTFVKPYEPISNNFLLLQTSDYLLLQAGGKMALETA